MRAIAIIGALALPLVLGVSQAKASLDVGQQAPCVVLTNIAANGTESDHCIREPNVKGQSKIIEFFSATCSDCAENLPLVSHLAMTVGTHATTRLVGIDRSEPLLRDFVKKNRSLLNFEVALDTNRDAKRAYDIIETPTTFVLDANDKVIYRHAGVFTNDDIATIEHLVGAR